MPEQIVSTAKVEERKTFTDWMRQWFKGMFLPIAKFFNRLGIKPNTVTLLGLVGHFAGAALVATGHITWGGIVVLLMAPVDFLDGTMARLRGVLKVWRVCRFSNGSILRICHFGRAADLFSRAK